MNPKTLVVVASLMTTSLFACDSAVDPQYLATLTKSVDHVCACKKVWAEAERTTDASGVVSMTRAEKNRIAGKASKCIGQVPQPLKIPTPDGSINYRYVEGLNDDDRGKVESLQARFQVCHDEAMGHR